MAVPLFNNARPNIQVVAVGFANCVHCVATAAGLGAANVCELERAHPDDALLHALTMGEPPTTLALFVTQLLTDSHQSVMRALLVSSHCSDHPSAGSLQHRSQQFGCHSTQWHPAPHTSENRWSASALPDTLVVHMALHQHMENKTSQCAVVADALCCRHTLKSHAV